MDTMNEPRRDEPTDEPITLDSELVQWGKYCETVGDVSLHQWRALRTNVTNDKAIAAATKTHADAKVSAEMARAKHPGIWRPAPSAGYPGNQNYPADAGYVAGATVDALGNLISRPSGPGRPEHLEENKALKEMATPTNYPSEKVIEARAKDTHAKSQYEASIAEPHPVADPVLPDTVRETKNANWPEAKNPIVDTDAKHQNADLDSKGHKRK